jgi:sugar/nucleoside kinase (ribokinase family)
VHVFVAGPVSWNRLVLLDRLPEARPHTVFARGHRTVMGGTSAGKALNLAGLGAHVTLRTVVGDDEPGRVVVDLLTDAGVAVIAEVVDDPTEQHLNLMDPHGGRVSIYLESPTLRTPHYDDRVRAALTEADAAVIDLAGHARPFLSAARDADIPIWCDLHDYDGTAAFHRDFLEAADYLFLNDDGMPDRETLTAFLTTTGKRAAVATLGAEGALAVAGNVTHHVPAAPVETIVDTNGAGDAFFAGFLVAHLTGATIPDALAAGASHAAKCLGSPNLAP